MGSANARTFHLDLRVFAARRAGLPSGERLFLKVRSSRIPIVAHSDQTRFAGKELNRAAGLLLAHREDSLTHFAEIPEDLLRDDAITWMSIVGEDPGGSRDDLPDLYHVHFHVPERVMRWYAERTFQRLGRHVVHPKLAHLGMEAPADRAEAIDLFVHADRNLTPWDTAAAILVQNPELAHGEPHTFAVVKNDHVAPSGDLDWEQFNRVTQLADCIAEQGPATSSSGFARKRQATAPDGTPLAAGFDWKDKKGDSIYQKGQPVMIYALSEDTLAMVGQPASFSTRSARNDPWLQSKTWAVDHGRPVDHKIVEEAPAGALVSASSSSPWTVTQATPNHGLSVYPKTLAYDASRHRLSINVKNTYLRTLGVYVQFFRDVQMTRPIDHPQVPDIPDGWPFYFPKEWAEHYETASKKALRTLTNVNTIMGIPCPTDATTIEVPWPEAAAAARLLFGGFGTSRWDNHIVWPGFILTGIFQIGVPALLAIVGVKVTNTHWFEEFIANDENVISVLSVAFPLVTAAFSTDLALENTKKVCFRFADIVVGLMLDKAMETAFSAISKKLVAQEALNAIPVVGWGFAVLSAALAISEIAVTVGEVLSSPCVLEIDIKRPLALDFTLKPDPKHGDPNKPIWPAAADHCAVIVHYEDGSSYHSVQKLRGASPRSGPLRFEFSPVGWGGKFQITANVFSRNGWLCGKYQSGLMPAVPRDGGAVLKVEGSIEELLVPLTGDTQYSYKQQVFYTDQDKHHWIAGSVPTATLSALKCSNDGHDLCKPLSLTINHQASQVGYAFRASGQNLPFGTAKGKPNNGQMYTMQGISVMEGEPTQKRLKFSTFGFEKRPAIAYSSASSKGNSANDFINDNFILDSRNGHHLRQVMLMDGEPDFGLDQPELGSWGRFYIEPDVIAIHPNRVAIATNYESGKIQILRLPSEAVPDKDAPEAQIVSGQGALEGLTRGPVAVTIAPDGRALVLEALNKRVQAFDTNGNPVPSFPGRRLATLFTPQYAPDLDQGRFSDVLQSAFETFGITHIFDLDREFVSELDEGWLTIKLVDAFAAGGVQLTYDFDEEHDRIEPVGSSNIRTIVRGEQWKILDPNWKHIYDIRWKDNTLQVFDVLNDTHVAVIAKGKRWVIYDLNGTKSYLGAVDPERSGDLNIFEYLSYMPLHDSADRTHIDMAVDVKGYIYVLSHETRGSVANTDYALDIYNPDGSFLVRTPDPKLQPSENMQHVAAARIAVDTLRDLYTLNYATFRGPGGRTEPSVSRWSPTPPLFDLDNTKPNFSLFNGDMNGVREVFKKHDIVLSGTATKKTNSEDGHWTVSDGAKTYDVVASVDRIYVYGIAA